MSTLSLIAISHQTASVMQAAVISAVQLNNFPLNTCDVQCAFDCWTAEFNMSPVARLHPGYASKMEEAVRANLALLGYSL